MILCGIFKYKLRKGKDMRLKGAITILKKQAESLGMTFDEVVYTDDTICMCPDTRTLNMFLKEIEEEGKQKWNETKQR